MKKTRLIQGVGINDADYHVTQNENGKQVWVCPYYETWKSMLMRGHIVINSNRNTLLTKVLQYVKNGTRL